MNAIETPPQLARCARSPLRSASFAGRAIAREAEVMSLITAAGRLDLEGAGRARFELARELYTPYPLSRRVLSATQPPPRGSGPALDSIRQGALSYLAPDGGTRRSRRAPHGGSRPPAGLRSR